MEYNIENRKIQIERLKRHYEYSIKNYDVISLLDLANSLRYWTEYADVVDSNEIVKLKTWHLSKIFKKVVRNSEYIYSYFPINGVTTSASATQEQEERLIIQGPDERSFTVGSEYMFSETGDLTIKQFEMIYSELSAKDIKEIGKSGDCVCLKDTNLAEYLKGPAINFCFSNSVHNSISRELLIKRIANEYDSSHPSEKIKGEEVVNSFSKPIKKFMLYRLCKLPLPYFILLNIAENIIAACEANKLTK